MRTAAVLGTNLLVGAAVLAWVLVRHGAPALALLVHGPRLELLALFPLAVAASFAAYALRWQVLLAGLGVHPRLASLIGYRAAGQSLSSLIPSGKLGGEPLRTLLLARGGVSGAQAIAAVAVDRTLEMGAASAFACAYALVLLRRGVPALEGALVTVVLGAVALAIGVTLTARRIRRGAGLVTALARGAGLTRLAFVRRQMDVLAAAETEAARLVAQPARIACAFALGLGANLLVMGEYALLLAAFGLPGGPVEVVAAVFATGAAHSLPVPAAVGALEGAEVWLFGMLGYPADVGLAVGLAVRLREVVWIVPGLVYLLLRAPGLTRGALTSAPGVYTGAPPDAPRGGFDARTTMKRLVPSLAVLAVLSAGPGVAAERPVPGKKLVMKAKGSKQTMAFIAKTALDLTAVGDPTSVGATLKIVNPASAEVAVLDLPASGWKRNKKGNVAKFRGSPIKLALVKQKSGLKVIGKTTGITLDEPKQGSIGLVLTLGPVQFCALFGGTVKKDEPGKFIAKKAPPPPRCPSEVGCGNGRLDPGEDCESNAQCGASQACANCQCVGTGDVSVTLFWADINDVDLHVIDPNGEELYYGDRLSLSGGMLDRDANADCREQNLFPVENIVWPTGTAPHGTFTVRVNFWRQCDAAQTSSPFTVRTIVDGATTTYPGTVTAPDRSCGRCGTGGTGCTCVDVATFSR